MKCPKCRRDNIAECKDKLGNPYFVCWDCNNEWFGDNKLCKTERRWIDLIPTKKWKELSIFEQNVLIELQKNVLNDLYYSVNSKYILKKDAELK